MLQKSSVESKTFEANLAAVQDVINLDTKSERHSIDFHKE